MQLCSSLSILWHCLSLGLEWKLTFSSPVATTEFSKFAGILRATYRVLPREHTGHSKHPLPTTQEKTLHMDITRWLIPKSDWLCFLQPKMETFYTVSKNKTGSWLWHRPWTTYWQIQTEIEKSRETTRPFRYDLNQISYNYTVEVTNRFKGLDLIDRVPEELWTEVCDIVLEAVIKTIPKKKKCKKAK